MTKGGEVVMGRESQRDFRKITPAATHTYFYDGWLLIKEIVATTNGTTDVIEYHWGKDLSGTIGGAGGVGGLLYLSISNSSTPNSSTRQLYIPFYDAYGNVMGYWDAQGNVVAKYTYDAFGKLIASSGPMADVFSFRYSTKYYDSETGFYYYGYRFYSPELMRWISRDPIGEEGGVNLYEFCNNFPAGAYDKDGRFTIYVHTDGVGHVGISNKGGTTFDYGRYHGKYTTGLLGKMTYSGPNILVRGKGIDGKHTYTRFRFSVCPLVDSKVSEVLEEKFASGLKCLPSEVIARYDKKPGPLPENRRYMGSDWTPNNNCMTFTFNVVATAAGRVGQDNKASQLERRQAMAMASLSFLACWRLSPSRIKAMLSNFANNNNWITEE